MTPITHLRKSWLEGGKTNTTAREFLSYKSGNVRELIDRKHRHPLLLGGELDWQVQEYVNASHLNSGIVNMAIVIAPGEGP